jgi:hypothetical protein
MWSVTTGPEFLDSPVGAAGCLCWRATGFASTADIALVVPPFDWRHVAEAQRGAQLLTPDYDYRWYLGISEVQDYFASAPELSPVSFAEFLGSGQNPTAFGYGFNGLDRHRPGELSPNAHIRFRGGLYVGSVVRLAPGTPNPEQTKREERLLIGAGSAP